MHRGKVRRAFPLYEIAWGSMHVGLYSLSRLAQTCITQWHILYYILSCVSCLFKVFYNIIRRLRKYAKWQNTWFWFHPIITFRKGVSQSHWPNYNYYNMSNYDISFKVEKIHKWAYIPPGSLYPTVFSYMSHFTPPMG